MGGEKKTNNATCSQERGEEFKTKRRQLRNQTIIEPDGISRGIKISSSKWEGGGLFDVS